MVHKKTMKVAKALKRGFKTLAVKRKGNKAAKLAKELKSTRGVLRDKILRRKRAHTVKRAKRLLGVK